MRPKYTSVAAVAYSVAGAGAVHMRPKWHLYVIRQGELFFLRCVICWRMLTVFTTAIYVSSFVGGIYYCNICVLIRRSFWLRRQIHAYLLTYADGIYYCYICIYVSSYVGARAVQGCSREGELWDGAGTCFTGTKVRALLVQKCLLAGTKVQILTQGDVSRRSALMSTQVLLYVCVAAPQLYSTLHIAMCLRPLCRRRCCYMFALQRLSFTLLYI